MVAGLSYHCTNSTDNFSLIACLQMKLWLIKVGKLDAYIRPIFCKFSHNYTEYLIYQYLYTAKLIIHDISRFKVQLHNLNVALIQQILLD